VRFGHQHLNETMAALQQCCGSGSGIGG
jgi:hypothetical protein